MIKVKNEDLRNYAKYHKVFLYEIAKEAGISEATITRKFRNELTAEDTAKYRMIVDKIAASR